MTKIDHPSYGKGMFKGAPPENFGKARRLRENMTWAEKHLWEEIKSKKLGFKFRRQHPLHLYIADFYCHKLNLIIELDGKYHQTSSQRKLDEERSENLEDQGIEIIRFTNEEITEDMVKVVESIKEKIEFISGNKIS